MQPIRALRNGKGILVIRAVLGAEWALVQCVVKLHSFWNRNSDHHRLESQFLGVLPELVAERGAPEPAPYAPLCALR